MRTRIKVCCIASPDEAKLAVDAGADAIGLVGAMPSGPGPISDDLIFRIASLTPPPVATFLLTSETKAGYIADHVIATGASTVQIVEHIDDVESAELAALLPGTRRVQVIHVEDASALDLVPLYAPYVHAFLLDSGRPSKRELGGTGRVHDWEISARFVKASPRPVFLAGGLTPANVGDAIRAVRPYGVDVCSGLRTDGALDPAKLAAFVDAVGAADRA